jgi:hypothetical protein
VPEHKKPSRAIQPTADYAGRCITTRKSERLNKREKPTEYISACHGKNATHRMDRILRKQKSGGEKVDGAHNCLKNRNESVNAGEMHIRERYCERVYDRERDDGGERNIAVSRAYRLIRDHYGEISI